MAEIPKQADRIIARFGGPRQLSEALAKVGEHRDVATVYKWTYPRERGGTGGVIPTGVQPHVIRAAKAEGVQLTMEDWFGEDA